MFFGSVVRLSISNQDAIEKLSGAANHSSALFRSAPQVCRLSARRLRTSKQWHCGAIGRSAEAFAAIGILAFFDIITRNR
ncbi:MAG TPA: hypothetical protein VMA09_15830 [Candidatus Binataceae bacterium]|nr:hypothetical protein [Candidatus Binataceae bacterium]